MNKQIEEIREMAKCLACNVALDEDEILTINCLETATRLYLKGYRKASQEGAECPTCHGTGRIGTTDWLTKNISKEQLAKEKAEAVAEHEAQFKRNVAREIFEEIDTELGNELEKADDETIVFNYDGIVDRVLDKLKKKYESEGAE